MLHVIRPALKPYVPMIDGILELFSLVGALAASTLLAPVHAAYAWWNASDPPASGSSSSSSAPSDNEDEYARRVALGDRTASAGTGTGRLDMAEAHRRAQAALAEVDEAQARHRAFQQQQQRHTRNNSSSSSDRPRAPGAWTTYVPPTQPGRRTSNTFAAATGSNQPIVPPLPQSLPPRPPSRADQYPPRQRTPSGSGQYAIWYPPASAYDPVPVPPRAPSPGSTTTQTFFYPPGPSPPPPYQAQARRASTGRRSTTPEIQVERVVVVPDTPARFPGALPFPTPMHLPARLPTPPLRVAGFEIPHDELPPSMPVPKPTREKELPSPPPTEDAMDVVIQPPTRPKSRATTRKRTHEPEIVLVESDSDGGSDTSRSSVVKKRRVAGGGGRVARRVAAIEEEPPASKARAPRLKEKKDDLPVPQASNSRTRTTSKPAPVVNQTALAHQSGPAPAQVSLSRSTRSRSRAAGAGASDVSLAGMQSEVTAAAGRMTRRGTKR